MYTFSKRKHPEKSLSLPWLLKPSGFLFPGKNTKKSMEV